MATLVNPQRQEWATPWALFRELDSEFHFTLDAAAAAENAKVPGNFITRAQDALTMEWPGRVWLNPPYGRRIGEWILHAAQQVDGPAEVVVALLPVATSTLWWSNIEQSASEVRFIRSRVKFQNSLASVGRCRFDSVLVIWRKRGPGSFSAPAVNPRRWM